ncbi:DUF2231 domain-containing protein [Nocardioides sp.]|uniref:DUF2231 domain-containing protein n=1 Tax=Nocardioides sp. TaxID=35761 RepID=UPI002B271857|nr:DUF2231 domain-containing protein [Nocardioides sp.]
MEINGLPLHPLVVHAAVVFGPLAALLAIVYVVRPAWQERLRAPLVVMALVTVASIVTAFVSGNSFRDANAFFAENAQIDRHQERAGLLIWVTVGFGVVALLAAFWRDRGAAVRLGLHVLLAAAAIALLVLVVLTGDAGARAVYPPDSFNG